MEGHILLACVRSEQSQPASQASGRHTHLNSFLRSRDSSRSSRLHSRYGTKPQGRSLFTFPYYLRHVQNPQMQGVSKAFCMLLMLSSLEFVAPRVDSTPFGNGASRCAAVPDDPLTLSSSYKGEEKLYALGRAPTCSGL